MPKHAALLLPLFIALIPFGALSQDSTLHRVGVFADIDDSLLDYAGIRYRLTDSWTCFVRARINFNDHVFTGYSYATEESYSQYEFTFGIERIVLTVDQLLLFVHGSFAYGGSKQRRDESPAVPSSQSSYGGKTYNSTAAGGIGAEHFFTPRVSLAVRQSVSCLWVRSESWNSLDPGSNRNAKLTYFRYGQTLATFTLYF